MPSLLARAVPDLRSGRWQLRACSRPTVARQRGKRLLYCTITYLDAEAEAEHVADIVVKVAGGDRRGGYDALNALWQRGFRPPSPFRVPRPLGYSEVDDAIVLERVRGPLWADRLGGPLVDLLGASELATQWLLELQRQPPGPPPSPTRGAAVAPGRSDRAPAQVAADLAHGFPPYARRLTLLAGDVEDALAAEPGVLVATHGDFHPKNVILTDAATTVLDFDTFGAREAAFDVGYAMGQLLVMSRLRLGRLGPGAAAAGQVWSRYAEHGTARWDPVRAHVARTLMQSLHFELCVLRNNHVELLDLWPGLIESLLDSRADGVGVLRALERDAGG